jgi:hypothetical protein
LQRLGHVRFSELAVVFCHDAVAYADHLLLQDLPLI